MLIICSYCNSRVDGAVLAENEEWDPEEDPFRSRVVLVRCPSCGRALLGSQEKQRVGSDEYEWSYAIRLWPDPENFLHHSIPEAVRQSLEEAKLCIQAKAYSACAVMCGRAIEAMCVHFT